MARISSYPRDLDVVDNDSWIGTESSNRQTKNYTAAAVAKYLNINQFLIFHRTSKNQFIIY